MAKPIGKISRASARGRLKSGKTLTSPTVSTLVHIKRKPGNHDKITATFINAETSDRIPAWAWLMFNWEES